MRRTIRAISKQLLGARYEHVMRSAFVCLVLFFSLEAAEMKVEIHPYIFYLSAFVFSTGVMLQALHSSRIGSGVMGQFMLPFHQYEFTIAYVLAFTEYTIFTKTSIVLSLFFALKQWKALQAVLAILFACAGCIFGALGYSIYTQHHWEPMNAYAFYRIEGADKLENHRNRSGNLLVYMFRYLFMNKNYIVNSVGLCIIAAFLPMLLGRLQDMNLMLLGDALLCMNTPIAILLSCDGDLLQAIQMLPRQRGRLLGQYSAFIFLIQFGISIIYTVSWQLQYGTEAVEYLIAAILFPAQSAILSVYLEMRHPIRDWQLETDLWHHPRKYIVPGIMLLLAAVISMYPILIWGCGMLLLVELLNIWKKRGC